MPSGLETALVYLSWAYYGVFIGWWALLSLAGERLALQFFFNSLAHLIFLPLPLVLVVAVTVGHGALFVLGLGAVALWLYIWAGPFLPRFLRVRGSARGPALSVASFNLLWPNDDLDAVVRAIRHLDTDVVGLQELSPAHAEAIESRLCDDYPYQLLQPAERANGLGLLSRLPLEQSEDAIEDGAWLGEPVIAHLSLQGREVTVVVFHAAPVNLHSAVRERQATLLARYAQGTGRPVLVMGDLNATSVSPAGRILAESLQDAWLAAGWGFGHTFPGGAWSRAQGGMVPERWRRVSPRWLVRIDYIFASKHWQVRRARTAAQDGASDHRPVIAELRLR